MRREEVRMATERTARGAKRLTRRAFWTRRERRHGRRAPGGRWRTLVGSSRPGSRGSMRSCSIPPEAFAVAHEEAGQEVLPLARPSAGEQRLPLESHIRWRARSPARSGKESGSPAGQSDRPGGAARSLRRQARYQETGCDRPGRPLDEDHSPRIDPDGTGKPPAPGSVASIHPPCSPGAAQRLPAGAGRASGCSRRQASAPIRSKGMGAIPARRAAPSSRSR